MKKCIVTSFFVDKDKRFLFDNRLIWDTLGDYLQNQKIELKLLSTSKLSCKYLYLNIPYKLSSYINSKENNIGFNYPKTMLDYAHSWWDTAANERSLNECVNFYSNLLDKENPDIVLCWNMTHPISKILSIEAIKRGIPNMGIEKGSFPETLQIDTIENSYFTDLNTSHILKSLYNSYNTNLQITQNVYNYYRHKINFPNPLGQKPYIILYIGCYGANIIPNNVPVNMVSNNGFDSIQQCVSMVCSHIKDVDIYASIHPIDFYHLNKSNILDSLKKQYSNLRFINEIKQMPHTAGDQSLMFGIFQNSLFGIFAGNTTTQQEYLLFNKPIILLTKTSLSNKNIAYEFDKMSFSEILEGSFRGIFNESERAKYISFIFEHILFGSNRSPTVKKIMDLATHITSFII